ncbi:MAG: hypothetical protein VX730_05660 [Pseudomonadota bacterium]|nr:hypothetical protein [Pseudomonadota bacterium]
MSGNFAYAQCANPATNKCARATGLADVDFGTDDFAGDEIDIQSVCIYTQADGDGRARARNSGGSTVLTANTQRFAVDDGAGNELQVDVEFRGTVNTTWQNLRADQNYLNKFFDVGEHPAEDETCSIGGDTNDIRTSILRSYIGAALPGVYTGTISVDVRPD